MTSIEDFAILANMLIIGGMGGYFFGYLLKKVIKILVIWFGITVFLLASLALVGTINVNYEEIAAGITNVFNPEQASVILQAITGCLPLLASFIIGFLMGIGKK